MLLLEYYIRFHSVTEEALMGGEFQGVIVSGRIEAKFRTFCHPRRVKIREQWAKCLSQFFVSCLRSNH